MKQTFTLRRATTLHNVLFYAHSICLIYQTQKFVLVHCPIYAGMFLFCAGSQLKSEQKD